MKLYLKQELERISSLIKKEVYQLFCLKEAQLDFKLELAVALN